MITWEGLLFSALFSSCVIDVMRKAPVARVGGEGERKGTDRGRRGTFPYANQMLNNKQRREKAAVKCRCVWSWHSCPRAGTEGMDKETFGSTLHSLTAANCFQREPWNSILEMFWVRTKRLFQLWVQFLNVMRSFLAPWAFMWQQGWASESRPKHLSAQKRRGSWKVKVEINLGWYFPS